MEFAPFENPSFNSNTCSDLVVVFLFIEEVFHDAHRASFWVRGLTEEAHRPRLRRGVERSRGSKKLRESERQCRRGPSAAEG